MLQSLQDSQEHELSFNETATFMLREEASLTTGMTSRGNKRGRKRIPRLSKVQIILNNLPAGIKYIGPEGGMTEENVMAYARNPHGYQETHDFQQHDQDQSFQQPLADRQSGEAR